MPGNASENKGLAEVIPAQSEAGLEHLWLPYAQMKTTPQVGKIEALLGTGLEPCRKLAGVKDVRVKGAIGVVELDRIENLNALRQRFIEQGVFVRPFGSIVYLTPPFTIAEEDLAKLTGA